MHKPEEMILLLSDLGVGQKTLTFNAAVFEDRIRTLTSAVLRLREIHAFDRGIDRLYIVAAGDMIAGEPSTKRINLAEMDSVEGQVLDTLAQKRIVINAVTGMLQRFEEAFGLVEFVGVYGNHGRGRGQFASKRSNDDTEIYYGIADRFTGHRVIFTVEPTRFYQVIQVAGHPFLVVHGHQIKMWTRTPLYGIINAVTLWHQTLPEPFRYVLMGHFHALNYIDAVGTPVYLNGAFVDDDEYGMAKGLKATANQWVMGVHPTYGVTWERRVWLK